MKQNLYSLFCAACLFSLGAHAQIQQAKELKAVYGKPGIKRSISDLRAIFALRPTLNRPLDSSAIRPLKFRLDNFKNITKPGKSAAGGNAAERKEESGIVEKNTGAGNSSTQQIWSNFLALNFYDNPFTWPPDPNGAVGESQVIVTSNIGVRVFEKSNVTDTPFLSAKGQTRESAPAELSISLDEFFSPLLLNTSYTTDPHIRYDRLSKRWFIAAVEVNQEYQNNSVFLAVSDGDRVTDTSSFMYYSFNSSLFPYDPNAPYAPLLDYPTLGVDRTSVLIGGTQLGYDSLVSVGYVIDKQSLLRGQLVVYPVELGNRNLFDGTANGMLIPQGVYNDDPEARKSFFAGINTTSDGLMLATIDYDKKNRARLTSETMIAVGKFNKPRDNSSPGGLTPIDQSDTRLFAAAIYKNKLTNRSSLWTSHAIGVSKQGSYMGASDSDYTRKARTGSRWYEIENVYTTPFLSQRGTVQDTKEWSGRRATQYFNPSIAANGQGYAVIGGTTDAFNQYLNVFVAGRYNDDPAGTMQEPVTATNTDAIYAPYVNVNDMHYYIGRWGAFSQTVVDPIDDQTIWTFQEYANADDSYGIRAVQLKAPPPATPLPVGTLSNSDVSAVTIDGVSVDNSGFFDPGMDNGGPGYNRLSIKSSGGIAVTGLKFVNPIKIKFTLDTKNKPAGMYHLVITNPDGQSVTVDYSIEDTASGRAANMPVKSISALDKTSNYITSTTVFPNPATDAATIQINASKENQVKIILLDLSGKQVYEKSYTLLKGNTNAELPLSAYSKGTYIAAIYTSDNTLLGMQKIIKQ